MRVFFGVILLAAALTGVLLWNLHTFAPSGPPPRPSNGAGGPPARLAPADRVILVIGRPPGREPGAAPPAPPAPPEAPEIAPGREPVAEPGARPEVEPEEPPGPPPETTRRTRLQKGETVYGLAQRLPAR